jgi:hypothetical protein
VRWLLIGLVACGSTQLGEPVRGEAIEVEIASITLEECAADCAAHLQLSVRSSDARALPIAIRRVELLDLAGTSLATIPTSAPMRWNDQGLFTPWNETVAGGEILAATYTLGKASWTAGGHYDRTATYRVKLTVMVGSKERTVEKKATVAPEPLIET